MSIALNPDFLLGRDKRAKNGQLKGSWISQLPFGRLQIKLFGSLCIGFLSFSGCGNNPASSEKQLPDLIGEWTLGIETVNGERLDSLPDLKWIFSDDGTMIELSCTAVTCSYRNYDWRVTADSLTFVLQNVSEFRWKIETESSWLKIWYSANHTRQFGRIQL